MWHKTVCNLFCVFFNLCLDIVLEPGKKKKKMQIRLAKAAIL